MQAMGVLSSALSAISCLKDSPISDSNELDGLVKSMEEISKELLSPDPKDLVGLHELSLVDLNKAITVMRHNSLQANRYFKSRLPFGSLRYAVYSFFLFILGC